MLSRIGGALLAVLCLTLPFACAAEEAGHASGAADSPTADRFVRHVRWDDAITPVTRTFLSEQIEEAAGEGAAALLIELDTPGGLLDATRDIVTDFYDSPVPVIVWVGPSGARAASAGVFLTMAAHVAAMAPSTNIGAASPVSMGGGGMDSTMASKVFEDTAAFARSIAERRGRNVEWAQDAVRDAKSITETEALEKNVIDFVAGDVEELLEKADGKEVELPSGSITLAVAGARADFHELGWRYRLLSLLVNPNIAYILLMFGIYGIFFELSNPGHVLPGVVGAVFLILAFYSMQTLPMNLAGVLLIVVGLVLFLLEAHVPSFGLLTIGGIASTVLGAVMLFDSPDPALRASLGIVIPLTVVTSLLFALAIGLSIRTLRSRPTTGAEGMIGLAGKAKTRLAPKGTVEVRGELWQAVAESVLDVDDPVRVVGMDGLTLRVRRDHEA